MYPPLHPSPHSLQQDTIFCGEYSAVMLPWDSMHMRSFMTEAAAIACMEINIDVQKKKKKISTKILLPCKYFFYV